MKLSLIFSVLFNLFSTICNSQPITFQKIYYGDINESIARNYAFIEDNNEGYIFGNYGRLVRINKFGNLDWMMKFETTNWVESFINIVKTSDNGYLTSGSGVLLKLDSLYSISWIKDVSLSFGVSINLLKIYNTLDSKFIIWGSYYNSGTSRPILVKVDELGNIEWAKAYVFAHYFENIGSICISPDNGFITCGSTPSLSGIPGAHDIIVARFDSIGNTIWSNRYGSGTFTGGYHISSLSDSNFIVTGRRNTEFYLMKINPQGNTIWQKKYNFGLGITSYWAEETIEFDIITTGMGSYNDSTGLHEVPYLMKTDSSGNIEWFRIYQGYYFNEPGCVHETNDDGFAISSRTPSFGSQGLNFGFIKTDSLGFTSGCSVFSPSVTEISIADTIIPEPVIDSTINVIFVPLIYSPPIFGAEATICTSVGLSAQENFNSDFKIVPNPSNGKFKIVKPKQKDGIIEILELNGRLIDSYNFENEKQIEIDISSKSVPGVYFVKFISEDAVKTQKIVIY